MDARLIMFREDGRRIEIPILPGVSIIGRQDDCAVRIPLAVVSRHHAQITADGSNLVLKDLGGTNGTLLNNLRVEDEEDLEPGDQIMIGPVVFILQIDGEPADDEIIEVRSKVSKAGAGAPVGTSSNVSMSDDDVDPISELEALASSSDQTAINPEDDD